MKKTALLVALSASLLAQPALAADTAVKLCSDLSTGSGLPDDKSYLGHMDAGPNGWLYVDSDFADQSPLDADMVAAFGRFNEALKSRGTALVFAAIPSRPMVYPAELSADIASSRKFDLEKTRKSFARRLEQLAGVGITAPDLYQPLVTAAKTQPVFFAHDHHLTPEGAMAATAAIAASVKGLKAYSSIPEMRFESIRSETRDNDGSYDKLVKNVCKNKLPAEPINISTTRAVGGASAGLLDGDEAQIALIGTSMSNRANRDDLNFAGSLRVALSRDVTNAAVEGGWIDASIISYLDSDSFRTAPAKIMVWEMPGKYLPQRYSRFETLFRQIIPAARGACAADKAMAKQDSTIASATAILDASSAGSSKADRDFIYFEASDLALVNFTLKLSYKGGTSEEVEIERSTRKRNSGRFFLELAKDNLTGVSLIPEGKGKGNITARLCRG